MKVQFFEKKEKKSVKIKLRAQTNKVKDKRKKNFFFSHKFKSAFFLNFNEN